MFDRAIQPLTNYALQKLFLSLKCQRPVWIVFRDLY